MPKPCTRVDRLLEDRFGQLGLHIGRHPLPFILVPIIISLLLGCVLRLKDQLNERDVEWLYTPLNARSVFERATVREHWPIVEDEFIAGRSFDLKRTAQAIVVRRDGGNILEPQTLDLIQNFNDWVVNGGINGSGIEPGRGRNLSFKDLCLRWRDKCSFTNNHIFVLDYLVSRGNAHFASSQLTFPRLEVVRGSSPIYVGNLVGGVDLENGPQHPLPPRSKPFGEQDNPFGIRFLNNSSLQRRKPKREPAERHLESSKVIRSAKALYLIYYLRSDTPELREGSRTWERSLANTLEQVIAEKNYPLDFAYLHSSSLFEGIEENSAVLTPKFMITKFVLVTFAITNAFRLIKLENVPGRRRRGGFKGWWASVVGVGVDHVRSKPLLGFCGFVTSAMGIICSVGALFSANYMFNAIISVMPFLIMAIGLDDMFIMMAAWHATNPLSTPEERLSDAMRHSAVSISITSITSFISFLIGLISELPAVKIFCLYTAAGMLFNYAFQITFFAGCMALSGRYEAGKRLYWQTDDIFTPSVSEKSSVVNSHLGDYAWNSPLPYCIPPTPHISLAPHTKPLAMQPHLHTYTDILDQLKDPSKLKVPNENYETKHVKTNPTKNGYTSNSGNSLSQAEKPSSHEPSKPDKPSLISSTIAPLILNKFSKTFIIFIMMIYLGVAILGVTSMEEGLDQQRIVVKGHHLIKFYTFLNRYFWSIGQQVEIVVNRVPPLRYAEERVNLHKMVASLENTSHTMGREATDFFLREYELFLNRTKTVVTEDPELWSDAVFRWSRLSAYSRNIFPDLHFTDINSGSNPECSKCVKVLKAFRFRVGLKDFNSTNDQRAAADAIRSRVAMYPEYNITTYHQEWPFMDQYAMIAGNTIISIGAALASMTLISAIFFNNVLCTFWIVLTIVSIDIGVIGFLSLWGVNLDCISLVTIIMSIGLSVDYAAHVAYSYLTAQGTPQEKVVRALEAVGLPVIQGAISTLLGVFVLLSVDAYIVQVFFKTTSLVIVLGIIHACIFLPVLLSTSEALLAKCKVERLCS